MPLIITKGTSSAAGFGRGIGEKEPPGSYIYPNGFSGNSYKPKGYNFVTLTLYGSNGNNGTSRLIGSSVTKNNVPVSSLQIFCPVSFRQSQWAGGGNGGYGGNTSRTAYKGLDGGAVTAAEWTGGVMVAAGGGGGASISMAGRVRRMPAPENGGGYGTIAGSGNNGGNGQSGACYYGGGGGGGGYSLGGNGGLTNNGGNSGNSYGYDTISTGSVGTAGFAKIEWS